MGRSVRSTGWQRIGKILIANVGNRSRCKMTILKRYQLVTRCLIAGIALLSMTGCKPEPPKEVPPQTVPVSGKVIDHHGQPLEKAMVEFRAVQGKPWTTFGLTDAQGEFTLETMVNGEKLAGAVVGDHRVSVTPPFTDSPEQSSAAPYQLRRPLKVEAEKDNFFTIEMPR